MNKLNRVPHCSHWGAYTIVTENNKIVDVEPSEFDPTPSPIIKSVKEWQKSDRRILTPMIRKSWLEKRDASSRALRGTEEFIPVSWKTAIEIVAGEISRVSQQYGNESIFAGSYGWASCGRFHHSSTMLKRLLNLVGGFTGHVDTYSYAAGPVLLRHVYGSTDAMTGKGTTLDTVIEHGETLLVFGSLSPRTAQNEAGGLARRTLEPNLREMVKKGIKIIHVSPLRDDIPEWVNAEWIPVLPNTDTALLLALTCEIVKANKHDASFLETHCSGSNEFLQYLSGDKDGIEKNADWAASITGIKAEQTRGIADRIASTRTMITMSWSLQRAHHGEQPYWAAIALAAACGQIGLPGGGVGFGYASLGGVGGPIAVGKNPAISAGRNPIDSFIPCARIADLLMHPGTEFSYEGEVCNYPDIQFVYWAGGNPFHHHQDLNRLAEAFRCPETIIVQDPFFTATALYADIVLPANTSIERNDIAANGRSDMMIAMHQAIPAVGESRSDYDIFTDIADLLGVKNAYTEGRSEMEWLRFLYEDARKKNLEIHDFSMPDFDTFWQKGYTSSPSIRNYTHMADFRLNPLKYPLKTESGKIVLTSRLLTSLNYADCPPHPAWLEPMEWLGSSSTKGKFHLISNQPEGRLHSQLETGDASMQLKNGGREVVRISPHDAAAAGLTSGMTVEIWNERGACLACLCIDDAVRNGVLVLPTGAWLTQTTGKGVDSAGNPNVLTPDIPASQFSQGCAAHTCLVSIKQVARPDTDAIDDYKEIMNSLGFGEVNISARSAK